MARSIYWLSISQVRLDPDPLSPPLRRILLEHKGPFARHLGFGLDLHLCRFLHKEKCPLIKVYNQLEARSEGIVAKSLPNS